MPTFVSDSGTSPIPERAVTPGELISFTISPSPDDDIQASCRELAKLLQEAEASPLHLLVFGRVAASEATMEMLRRERVVSDCPVTWVEGAACDGRPVAGIQVHAFTGPVERIKSNGRTIGSRFIEGGAEQCIIGGLLPADLTLSAADQTSSTLNSLQDVLGLVGFAFADIIRTWFFLDNILSWYDDFNQARTSIYSGVKFRTGSLPASTGVGARNPDGSALALIAWAFRPLEANARAAEVASPLQCPAPAYGSSFSRAMEVSSQTGRRLFVSGTASIAPGGETLWVNDVARQVELTLEVVEAILRSRGLAFDDVNRATAYFRHPGDVTVFAQWLQANHLTQMPVVTAQCDVCRDDLLFELEAEAETKSLKPSSAV